MAMNFQNQPDHTAGFSPAKAGVEKQKVCPACAATFTCGGCWCRDVPLSRSALSELSQTYDGCLCSACLCEVSMNDQAR